ncbi:helix-turn-helix domain-containing protein [Kitasatospora sp. LaBMicrA B282]|uniref:ArsR/SmtB family transcription factor n=1 Tax=Kitasatospora sp. LaBMicrA B282 TaxID=3420949 RepID=UPI003D0D0023
MWEVGTSFRLLRSGRPSPVHRSWLEQVRPRVAAAGLDRGWLAETVPPAGFVPDLVNPLPVGPAPTPAAEFAALLTVPAELVRRDLDRVEAEQGRLGPRLRALRADPAAHLPRLVKEVETYWELALAPYWARIRAVLEADVFHRARQVAEHGVREVFNDLHATVRWDANTLRLEGRTRSLPRAEAGTGLLLIPSAFAAQLLTRALPAEPLQIAYAARGLGALWEPRPVAPTAALAAVLGRGRTLLLAELATPASTTELARRTGCSAPGVSQQLTALRAAGLVSAHRVGRSVLYARTAAAETLLAAAG